MGKSNEPKKTALAQAREDVMVVVPKRLRYFLQRDTSLQGTVLRIFLSVVERCLRDHSPGCPADARIEAVAFIHRFGSSLNEHVHFHCCVIDGVFEPTVAPDDAPSVTFHAALELDAAAFADVQARVRTRGLRTFVRRALIDKDEATEMRAWAHDGGFSIDGLVHIEATDRTGLERLLRYCARPPLALEHLHQRDAEHLLYHSLWQSCRSSRPNTRDSWSAADTRKPSWPWPINSFVPSTSCSPAARRTTARGWTTQRRTWQRMLHAGSRR